jgi:hypothetical protein
MRILFIPKVQKVDPMKIPQIRQKLSVDPAVPLYSSLTAVIPKMNVIVVQRPLIVANIIILITVKIPTNVFYIN